MSESRAALIANEIMKAFREIVAKHNITHAEYLDGVEFLNRAAEMGEVRLLPDVFLESDVISNMNKKRKGTPSQVQGPYYVADSPWIDDGRLANDDEPGERLTVRGVVRDVDRKPLAETVLDFWHADSNGRYSNFNSEAQDGNLRGRTRTARDGSYVLRTIIPAQYMIPHDGPTGRLLNELGRHAWRPSHIHLKATHDGYLSLTTQIYFEGDEYLESDSVRAAITDLAFPLQDADGGKEVEVDIELETA